MRVSSSHTHTHTSTHTFTHTYLSTLLCSLTTLTLLSTIALLRPSSASIIPQDGLHHQWAWTYSIQNFQNISSFVSTCQYYSIDRLYFSVDSRRLDNTSAFHDPAYERFVVNRLMNLTAYHIYAHLYILQDYRYITGEYAWQPRVMYVENFASRCVFMCMGMCACYGCCYMHGLLTGMNSCVCMYVFMWLYDQKCFLLNSAC